jgi:hypothetical protein
VHAAIAPHCCHAASEKSCSKHDEHEHRRDQSESQSENFSTCTSNSSGMPGHVCPHSSCQWLGTKPLCPSDLFHFVYSAPVDAATTDLVSSAIETAASSDQSECRTAALPLRLYLALGVLLI